MNLSTAIQLGEAIAAMYRGDLPANNGPNGTDTQYRLEEPTPKHFVVVLPGTASLTDFRTDAKILKTKWLGDGAMVHCGFAQATTSIFPELADRLVTAESVTLAGHSLGGAIATLAADLLTDMGVPVDEVYTFGSPRVGNFSFAQRYNEDLGDVTYRFVNARDPVPWLPFPLRFVRTGVYTHVAQRIYLTHDGELEFEPFLPHLADAIATVRDQAQQQKFFGDILTARCHQMTAYLQKLKGLTLDQT